MKDADTAPGGGGKALPHRSWPNRWIQLGALTFLLSRLWILCSWDPHSSDTLLYFGWARTAASQQNAYSDFAFPYPPLSLLLVYLPSWLGAVDFGAYRTLFQCEMLAIELVVVLVLVRIARRNFGFSDRQVFFFLATISVLGVLVGQLLYDRIDLGVALACSLLLVLSFDRSKLFVWIAASNLGFLFKFVPVVPAALLALIQFQKASRSARVLVGLALVAPSLLAIELIDRVVRPGIVHSIAQHLERGIQIESTWATPFMIEKAWFGDDAIAAEATHGACHLIPECVPKIVLVLSEYLGVLILLAWAMAWWIRPPSWTPPRALLTVLCSLLVFLCTQRVLSPQYFIWTMPFLALGLVQLRFPPHETALTLVTYAATYLEFAGYWFLADFDPFFVGVLAIRNLTLIALAMAFGLRLFRLDERRFATLERPKEAT